MITPELLSNPSPPNFSKQSNTILHIIFMKPEVKTKVSNAFMSLWHPMIGSYTYPLDVDDKSDRQYIYEYAFSFECVSYN